jgi:hypothetical protein
MTPMQLGQATQSRCSTDKLIVASYCRSKVAAKKMFLMGAMPGNPALRAEHFRPIVFHHAINQKPKQIVLFYESHTHCL